MENSTLFKDWMPKKPIIINKSKLQPEYVPDRLPERDKEIKEIADILSDALNGDEPSDMWIFGKSGTGKTAITKYILRELIKVSESRNNTEKNVKVLGIYINCSNCRGDTHILREISNELIRTHPETRIALKSKTKREYVPKGLVSKEYYDILYDILDILDCVYVLILDEVDNLKRQKLNILYELSRHGLKKSKLSIIGISNDLRFYQQLDSRVTSSFGDVKFVITPYNANQLTNILKYRSEESFREGSVPHESISLIAALSAQEHGDARKGVQLLRRSGEIAFRSGSNTVKDKHIYEANKTLEKDHIQKVVSTLPIQEKLLLVAICKLVEEGNKSQNTGVIYDMYCKIAVNIGLTTLTQIRTSMLLSELDTLGLVSARILSRGRYGRTREFRLSISYSEIYDAFENDDDVRDLIKPIKLG